MARGRSPLSSGRDRPRRRLLPPDAIALVGPPAQLKTGLCSRRSRARPPDRPWRATSASLMHRFSRDGGTSSGVALNYRAWRAIAQSDLEPERLADEGEGLEDRIW